MPTALVKTRSMPQPAELEVDPRIGTVQLGEHARGVDSLDWDIPTSGTVYGTLLNYRGALAALGDAVHQAPYNKPPVAPVLYIKPANCRIGYGGPIPVPDRVDELEVGPALGIVIGRTACRVAPADAFDYVRGYTLANDVCIPHTNVFRPAIRERCRDGFCPLGPWILEARAVPAPDRLNVRVFINGERRCESTTANLIRPVAQLIADVTDFITLSPGDVLLVGVPENAPRARAWDRVCVEVEGVGLLENPLVPERQIASGAAI